jgi:hypothetical protein
MWGAFGSPRLRAIFAPTPPPPFPQNPPPYDRLTGRRPRTTNALLPLPPNGSIFPSWWGHAARAGAQKRKTTTPPPAHKIQPAPLSQNGRTFLLLTWSPTQPPFSPRFRSGTHTPYRTTQPVFIMFFLFGSSPPPLFLSSRAAPPGRAPHSRNNKGWWLCKQKASSSSSRSRLQGARPLSRNSSLGTSCLCPRQAPPAFHGRPRRRPHQRVGGSGEGKHKNARAIPPP